MVGGPWWVWPATSIPASTRRATRTCSLAGGAGLRGLARPLPRGHHGLLGPPRLGQRDPWRGRAAGRPDPPQERRKLARAADVPRTSQTRRRAGLPGGPGHRSDPISASSRTRSSCSTWRRWSISPAAARTGSSTRSASTACWGRFPAPSRAGSARTTAGSHREPRLLRGRRQPTGDARGVPAPGEGLSKRVPRPHSPQVPSCRKTRDCWHAWGWADEAGLRRMIY